jgi:hypothetical protein
MKSKDSAPNTGTASTHIPTTSQFTSSYHQTTGDWDDICPSMCPPDLMCKCNLSIKVLDISIIPLTPHQAPNPNNYGRALMSAPPRTIAPKSHTNLLNVYIQIANKMGFKKKQKKKLQFICCSSLNWPIFLFGNNLFSLLYNKINKVTEIYKVLSILEYTEHLYW